jgi:hypothetical protein
MTRISEMNHLFRFRILITSMHKMQYASAQGVLSVEHRSEKDIMISAKKLIEKCADCTSLHEYPQSFSSLLLEGITSAFLLPTSSNEWKYQSH